MACPDAIKPRKQFKESEVLTSEDIMELVRLKRRDPDAYLQTLKDIAEVLRDMKKIVEEVNFA